MRQTATNTMPIVDTSPAVAGGHHNLNREDPAVAAPFDSASATGAPAAVSYGAQQQTRHEIAGVAWSYSAAPTGGNLSVFDAPGNLIFSVDITAAGPGSVTFPTPIASAPGNRLLIVLASGGSTVVGRVNALGHRAVQLAIAPSTLSLDFSAAADSGFIPVAF